MPPFADDLWYEGSIHSAQQEGASPFHAALETIHNHFLTDNGRLSNILFTFSLLLPKWIGNLISILSFAGAIVLSYRLISRFSNRAVCFPAAAISLFMCAYALPWYDGIYLNCYQFNYLLPTLSAIIAISIFLRAETRRGAGIICALAAGVFAGWFHEGIGVPLLCSFVGLIVLRPRFRTRHSFALVTGLFIGIAIVFSSPAALKRVAEDNSFASRLAVVAVLHPAFLLFLITSVLFGVKRSLRHTLSYPFVFILVVSATAAFAIHVASIRAPRAGWWCEFASIIGLTYMANISIRRHTNIMRIASVLMMAVVVTKSVAADYYAWQYRSDYGKFVKEYTESEDGIIWLDFTPEYASPLLTWMAPSFNLYYDRYQRWMFASCYGTEDKLPRVIPSRLRDIPFQPNMHESRLPMMRCDDYYVTSAKELRNRITNIEDSGEFIATLGYDHLKLVNHRVFYFLYRNSDGEELALLIPWRVYPLSVFGDLNSMTSINAAHL